MAACQAWWRRVSRPLGIVEMPAVACAQPGGGGGRARELDSFEQIWVKTCFRLTAKAGGGGAICIVPFLKASPWRSSRPLSATFEGNPRSDDRMTAALWCRSSLGGVILGGTHVIEGPEDGFFGGAVIYPTH